MVGFESSKLAGVATSRSRRRGGCCRASEAGCGRLRQDRVPASAFRWATFILSLTPSLCSDGALTSTSLSFRRIWSLTWAFIFVMQLSASFPSAPYSAHWPVCVQRQSRSSTRLLAYNDVLHNRDEDPSELATSGCYTIAPISEGALTSTALHGTLSFLASPISPTSQRVIACHGLEPRSRSLSKKRLFFQERMFVIYLLIHWREVTS